MTKYSYNDLFSDDVLSGIEKIKKNIGEIDTQINRIGRDNSGEGLKKLSTTVKDLEKAENDLLQKQKELEKQQIILEKTNNKNFQDFLKRERQKQKELEKTDINFQKQIELRKRDERAIREEAQALAKLEVLEKKELGTIERLQLENSQMVAVRKKLNLETQKGVLEYNRLTSAIKKNEIALKNYDKEIDRHQKNVGNYGSALTNFFGGIKNMLIGGGVFAVIQQTFQFLKDSISLAGKFEGVKQAFDNLNKPDLLENLRIATKGTVTDLELMQNAVKAQNFKIPLDQLATYFEFATKRAAQTGESVDYLVDSIITGIGRESKLVMDNLGISALELGREIDKVGSFGVASGNIIKRELDKMGAIALTTEQKIAKLRAGFANFKTSVGTNLINTTEEISNLDFKINPLKDALIDFQTEMGISNSEIEKMKDTLSGFLKSINVTTFLTPFVKMFNYLVKIEAYIVKAYIVLARFVKLLGAPEAWNYLKTNAIQTWDTISEKFENFKKNHEETIIWFSKRWTELTSFIGNLWDKLQSKFSVKGTKFEGIFDFSTSENGVKALTKASEVQNGLYKFWAKNLGISVIELEKILKIKTKTNKIIDENLDGEKLISSEIQKQNELLKETAALNEKSGQIADKAVIISFDEKMLAYEKSAELQEAINESLILDAEKTGAEEIEIERMKLVQKLELAKNYYEFILKNNKNLTETEIINAKNAITAIEIELTKFSKENESIDGNEESSFLADILGIENKDVDFLEEQLLKVKDSLFSFIEFQNELKIKANEAEIDRIDAEISKNEELLATEIRNLDEKEKAGVAYSNKEKQRLEREIAEDKVRKLKLEAEQKKYAEQRKRIAVGEAVMNTAVAIATALTYKPWWKALAASIAAGTAGAVQIATIKNTPAYAEGTEYLTLDGNPSGVDTIPAIYKGRKMMRLDEGERIVPKIFNKKLRNIRNSELPNAVSFYLANKDFIYNNSKLESLGNKQVSELQKLNNKAEFVRDDKGRVIYRKLNNVVTFYN